MRKKLGIYLLIFSVIFMISRTVALASDVIENNNSGIPDKGLYQAILNELGKKPNQKFTKQEAEKIKMIDASFRDIKSLKGIGYLKELEALVITGNKLKNLKKLEYLDISENEILSVNELKKLKKLKWLHFSYNQIKSLKGIDKLTNLKLLNAKGNQLKNIKQIKKLNASSNQLETLNGIQSLRKLKILYLGINHLTNVNEIESLKKLNVLELVLTDWFLCRILIKIPICQELISHLIF